MDFAGHTHSSRAAIQAAALPAAPGSVAGQDLDTAQEPVAPAVAAVRRFSLVSLFIAKLLPIIWCGRDRRQARNSFGLPYYNINQEIYHS